MTDDVRALSLWQPWASLVALGVKRIETRKWPTRYRGRVLIHAAKRPIRDTAEGRAPVGEYRPRLYGRTGVALEGPGLPEFRSTPRLQGYTLPFGAVVASCVLTDCVPMIGDMDPPPEHGAYVEVGVGEHLLLVGAEGEFPGTTIEGRDVRRIARDRMYGDYRPGRWAWLLDDVRATSERCPRCWGRRMGYEFAPQDEPPLVAYCPTCSGRGVCAPVPMVGRQGLWKPRWVCG